MSKEINHCRHCGRPGPRVESKGWYEDEISKLLKLTPTGKNVENAPYWSTHEKRWIIEVYEAVKKLKK